MNSLKDILRDLKSAAGRKRRMLRHSDPSNGLEYNNISPDRRISSRIYNVDLARTPNVIRDLDCRTDVHGEARKINSYRAFVDYAKARMKGRY